MRAPRSFAVVVRRKAGTLVVRQRAMADARRGPLAWPLVRGVVTLVDSIRLGSQALRFSAEHFEADMADEQPQDSKVKAAASAARATVSKTGGAALRALTGALVALASADGEGAKPGESKAGRGAVTALAIGFAVLLFVVAPQAAAEGLNRLLGLQLDIRSVPYQVFTGVFKLIIVLGYMAAIRRIPEIYRVFQYHGAEHKAIATYEAGQPLTVEHARTKSRLHPRCGTTFLVMVVFVSIVVFAAIGPLLPRLSMVGEQALFVLMKLPFLPVVAAITYEIQRLTARYCLRGPLRLTLWPGFAVQRITTIEPDDSQLEVALSSLQITLLREQGGDALEREPADEQYASFDELMTTAQPAMAAAQAS